MAPRSDNGYPLSADLVEFLTDFLNDAFLDLDGPLCLKTITKVNNIDEVR